MVKHLSEQVAASGRTRCRKSPPCKKSTPTISQPMRRTGTTSFLFDEIADPENLKKRKNNPKWSRVSELLERRVEGKCELSAQSVDRSHLKYVKAVSVEVYVKLAHAIG